MSKTEISMRDGWTSNPGYLANYQTSDQVSATLEMLDLAGARAFLDNACGNGNIAIRAAREHPNLQVWAYDALDTAIAECRKSGADVIGRNLKTGVAWADDLPLSSRSVDRMLFRNALHHVSDAQALYSELGRLLESGGMLLLQVPCNIWEDDFSDFLTDLHLMMDDTHPRRYHTPEAIVGGLAEFGIACAEPAHVKYDFPFIDQAQQEFVRERGFAERLGLEQIEENKWTVKLYQARILGRRG